LREDSTHAKALSDYEVTDDRLLGFKKDDIISVTKKDANVRASSLLHYTGSSRINSQSMCRAGGPAS
jgi:hypothetical protein